MEIGKETSADALAFLNYFVETFVSTYAVNLETRRYRVYKRAKWLDEDFPVVSDYLESLKAYAEREVYPEDREGLLSFVQPENLREFLREKAVVSFTFRGNGGRAGAAYRFYAIRGSDEVNVAFAFADISDIIRREDERKQASARAKAFERMTNEDAVFLIDCVNDTRRTIHDHCAGFARYSDTEKQSESFGRYVETGVAETDRARMRELVPPAALLKRLGAEEEVRIEYRDNTSGYQRFYEMRISRYSDTSVVLSFKEKDQEIINRLILERMEDDYFALFGVDLDSGMMQVLKDDSEKILGEAGTVRPYADAMLEFSSHFEKAPREFFRQAADIESLKRRFAKENKGTFVYSSALIDRSKWGKVTEMVLTRHADGTPSLFVLAFSLLDDDAREKAELQLKLRKALEAEVSANQRTEAMHEMIRSAYWAVHFDADRNVLGCDQSPGLNEVMRNDITSLEEWKALIHPDDRPAVEEQARKVMSDESGQATFDHEYRVRARDGEYHWIRSAGRTLLNPAGEGGEVYGMCIDIDDSVKRREGVVRQLEEAKSLERSNQAKSYFFSMVSHDIRTPLNAIIGYAELLKLGISDETERKRAIDSVLVSGHALLELINDVLDLSKLEAGKMEITPEPVDAVKLVRDVADTFRATIVDKPVEIVVKVQPMPWLKLDPHRVRQILFNLVGNAVKFTAAGTVTISSHFDRGENGRGTFYVSVSDTGCGISPEDQQRIAQPFVQVGSSANRSKGTGLGLAICNQLILKMGGEIRFASQVGVGTVFRVQLPDVEEEDPARRAKLSITQQIRYSVQEGRAKRYDRVLVVDDQLMNRMVLKNMLSRFAISEIVLAANGVEALEKLNAATPPFDLVLTDMWMPEMDGEGLIREIRKNPAWQDLPVYAVTADVEARTSHEAMGFTGLLLKPLTLEKLKDLLAPS